LSYFGLESFFSLFFLKKNYFFSIFALQHYVGLRIILYSFFQFTFYLGYHGPMIRLLIWHADSSGLGSVFIFLKLILFLICWELSFIFFLLRLSYYVLIFSSLTNKNMKNF